MSIDLKFDALDSVVCQRCQRPLSICWLSLSPDGTRPCQASRSPNCSFRFPHASPQTTSMVLVKLSMAPTNMTSTFTPTASLLKTSLQG